MLVSHNLVIKVDMSVEYESNSRMYSWQKVTRSIRNKVNSREIIYFDVNEVNLYKQVVFVGYQDLMFVNVMVTLGSFNAFSIKQLPFWICK